MTATNNELYKIFQTVTKTLSQNQQSLNQADTYNNDHGDNMVNTFETITNALKQKKGSNAGEALTYAANVLNKTGKSGSAKKYAAGLSQAAQQMSVQKLDAQSGFALLQTLLGGGQSASQAQPQQPAGGGDLLGSLLGGLTNNAAQDNNSSQQSSGGGLLGSLLGGLGGGNQQQAGGFSDGLDLGDLMTAGMAFMQSKQGGKDNLNAMVDAFTAASGMGNQPHRQQSTQLVASSFMQAFNKLMR